jgi:hypothetical protein
LFNFVEAPRVSFFLHGHNADALRLDPLPHAVDIQAAAQLDQPVDDLAAQAGGPQFFRLAAPRGGRLAEVLDQSLQAYCPDAPYKIEGYPIPFIIHRYVIEPKTVPPHSA